MRQHVTGANLGYWGSVLLPTGRGVINFALRFMKLSAAGSSDAKDQEMQFRALEKQIWATLPAFARWPRDGAAGLMYDPQPLLCPHRAFVCFFSWGTAFILGCILFFSWRGGSGLALSSLLL